MREGVNVKAKPDAQPVSIADAPRRGLSCLFWSLLALLYLLLFGAVIAGSVLAGWSSGLATARAHAEEAAAAEVQKQCEHIPADLEAGQLALAQRRLEALRLETPLPVCLLAYAPTATLLFQRSQARPTATATVTPAPATATPSAIPASATQIPATAAPAAAYDLEALLMAAQADLERGDYPSASDTLSAIASLDADYQREQVRRLLLAALSAQAEALYRAGKLSEANILTDRARAYGDIGSLSYEYFIADAYLNGQHYKTTNPAEAVRLLRRIVFEQGLPHYMGGAAVSELQDALRYYADALALQGDACQALDQYTAALELNPAVSYINRVDLTSRRQDAELNCATVRQAGGSPQNLATAAPVGQQSP